jgi:phosphate transport system substrate-binding protein
LPIVVYKRSKPACAAKAFATHYYSNPHTATGIGINGNDKDLSKAVKKDLNGVSYNNLGFIYDIKTRKVADSLAVIPLDLNENGKIDADEKVYATLDDLVNFVEKTNHPKIPTVRGQFIVQQRQKEQRRRKILRMVAERRTEIQPRIWFCESY